MAKSLSIVPKMSIEGLQASARWYLEQAIKEGYTTVIIHGIKDGKVRTSYSAGRNTQELIGALEVAKFELLRG